MLAATILGLSLSQPVAPPLSPEPNKRDFLKWRGPQPCPSASEVEASITRIAGRRPRASEVEVRGLASRSADGWQLMLATRTGDAEQVQTLRAKTCQELADATALIVAVLLDPVSTAARLPIGEPPADRGLTPPPPLSVEVNDTPTPVTATPLRWRFGLGVGLGGERGAIPRGTGGARITLFAQRGRFELRAAGSYWIPRNTEGPGASVQLGTAGASACFVPAVGSLQVPVCAGVEGGGLRARGNEVPNGSTATLPWLAATVGPSLRWWVRPRLGLFAAAEAFVPLISTQVTLTGADGERSVHEPAPAGFRGFLGVSVRFSGAP